MSEPKFKIGDTVKFGDGELGDGKTYTVLFEPQMHASEWYYVIGNDMRWYTDPDDGSRRYESNRGYEWPWGKTVSSKIPEYALTKVEKASC